MGLSIKVKIIQDSGLFKIQFRQVFVNPVVIQKSVILNCLLKVLTPNDEQKLIIIFFALFLIGQYSSR